MRHGRGPCRYFLISCPHFTLSHIKQTRKSWMNGSAPSDERKSWNESTIKEWSQWIKNGLVRILSSAEEQRIAKRQIIPAPMRYARTAKPNGEWCDHRAAPKSLDTWAHTGTYRTAVPTTSWVAAQVTGALACEVIAGVVACPCGRGRDMTRIGREKLRGSESKYMPPPLKLRVAQTININCFRIGIVARNHYVVGF